MSQSISNIAGSLEHVKGELYLLSYDPSPEVKITAKQMEKAIRDIEEQELVNLKKAAE